MSITLLASSLTRRITIVGFMEFNNGRSCDMHGCCGDLVIDHEDPIGLELRLRLTDNQELAAHWINADGTDGCRVGFASAEYAAGDGGEARDGAVVRVIVMYTPDDGNKNARALFHRNRGYAIAEIISLNPKPPKPISTPSDNDGASTSSPTIAKSSTIKQNYGKHANIKQIKKGNEPKTVAKMAKNTKATKSKVSKATSKSTAATKSVKNTISTKMN